MKLSVATKELQALVARAIKGSMSGVVPITSFMLIEVVSTELRLHTTDGTNYLYVYLDGIESGDFYVVVEAEQFYKLISKMTSETITLELKDNILEVKGNGTYKIKLTLDDETGELLTFPDPMGPDFDPEFDETVDVSIASLKSMIAVAKQSLSPNVKTPCYANYYVSDSVVTTDSYKVCEYFLPIFKQPRLISPEIMALVDVLNGEEVRFDINNTDELVVLSTDDVIIYGHLPEGIDEYSIEPIKGLLSHEFASMCKVSKSQLLALLDRLVLFVDEFDENAIRLTFTNDGLCVSSKQLTGTELLPYVEAKDITSFTCDIDVSMFQAQIKAQSGDTVTIHYGEDNAIKLTEGDKVRQIVALNVKE